MRKFKQIIRKEIIFSPEEWKKVEQRAASVFMKTATFIQNIAVSGEIRMIDGNRQIYQRNQSQSQAKL